MSMFHRRTKQRVLPKCTGKPLSSDDVLVRLRECWSILSPRRPQELTQEEVDLIGYNFQLASLYNEVSGLAKDGVHRTIGFGGDGDDGEDGKEDEEWYVTEVYCKKKGR